MGIGTLFGKRGWFRTGHRAAAKPDAAGPADGVKLFESRGAFHAGHRSFHNGPCHIAAPVEAPVRIGSYCAVGRNFTVMPVNHDTRFAAVQGSIYRHYFDLPHPGEGSAPSRQRSKGGVNIGSDVWIADNVTILSGVSIGDGACIGAGSIVTRSIAPYTIAAGVPCRTIAPRFPQEMVALLLDLKWWDWPEDRIRRNAAFFQLDLTQAQPDEVRALIAP
ncbi:CatB-related O-acetyltransferase [Xanthobacteraceae bacterium A53D]